MESAWSGKVLVSLLRAAYIGPVGPVRPHAHHAVQLCIALEGEISIDGRAYRAAVIPSGARHAIEGAEHNCVLVYLEPESADGRTIRSWAEGETVEALTDTVAEPVRRAVAANTANPPAALLDALSRALELAPVRSEAVDARIRRVLAELRENPDRFDDQREAATAAGLSPGRFRHLFREQIGVGYRRYLLWLRLLHAVGELADNRSLTEAAHAAGFADSAHLTRTFGSMFGLAPSTLRGNVVRVGDL